MIVPTAFDASVNATTLVRSDSAASNDAGSSVASSSRMSTQRTVAPASSAASTHGRTLASWSSRVTTTSSPGPSVRPTEREIANSSVVAFGPKTTSSASAFSRSAAARWASAITSSVSWLVANAPCALALLRRRYAAIASITGSGTWEPPGASTKTAGRPSSSRASAGNRDRTWARSGSVMERVASRTGPSNGNSRA